MRYEFLAAIILSVFMGSTAIKEGGVNDFKPGQIKIYDVDLKKHVLVDRIIKSDEQWAKILTPEQFKVMRAQGTERAFCQLPMNKEKRRGIYRCAACDTALFHFDNKFESGTGWPSFWQPIDPANVGEDVDDSHGMKRTEVHCARCGSHLGHVFDDGPPPTGKRYCINQVATKFIPENP